MTIESRAVRAARSIQMSVSEAHPAGVGVITRRHRAGWAVAVALVGLLAGASVALATVLPTAADDDIAGPPTTEAPIATTIPSEPAPPIIIPPVDGEDGEEGEGEGQDLDGTVVLITADDPTWGFDDLDDLLALGASWDDFGFGLDCTVEFPTTTTTTTTTKPPTTTTKPPNTTVTALQYYGPVHDQRYDKVYGTAPPGTIVTTWSDYGSSQMTVGESSEYGPAPGSSEMCVGGGGEYYLKIYFDETLPANQKIQWTATLKDPGGTVLLTKTFNFTYTPDYTVTANQKWGPEHDQPTEKIYGTAPPGREVAATSPYGSASMTVGGTGEYALVITFNSPPANEAFTISVTVAGEPFTFSFTYVVV